MNREKIKVLRKLQKLSQAELGRRVNLSASEISRVECGYRDLTEVEAAAIASVLGASAPIGLGAAKGQQIEAAPVSSAQPLAVAEPAVQLAPAIPPAKPTPAGSDLNDPANFGVLPDLGLLTPSTADQATFRARLSAEVSRANTILHTPRVPAAVWRAWRQFEQQAAALLRGATLPVAVPPPVAAVKPAPAPAPAAPKSAENAESKSFNSLFVEAARAILPAVQVDGLNSAAEAARQADSSQGFMKHFRKIAEEQLGPDLLKKINEEATRRSASSERWKTRRGRGQSASAAK